MGDRKGDTYRREGAGLDAVIGARWFYVLFSVLPIVRPKNDEDKVIMTIRIEKELQEKYDDLAGKSNRSRNELVCMALRYALENLEFLE